MALLHKALYTQVLKPVLNSAMSLFTSASKLDFSYLTLGHLFVIQQINILNIPKQLHEVIGSNLPHMIILPNVSQWITLISIFPLTIFSSPIYKVTEAYFHQQLISTFTFLQCLAYLITKQEIIKIFTGSPNMMRISFSCSNNGQAERLGEPPFYV